MLVTKNSTYFFAKNEAGGKGFQLYQMSQQGLPVPEWFIFGRRYFHQFIEDNHLQQKMNQILASYNNKNITGAAAETAFSDLFLNASVSNSFKNAVQNILQSFPAGQMFSVRSSAADEDSQRHSFAGQLSTFLYMKSPEQIISAIQKCWASAFSERGLAYRRENNLSIAKISVAVVLQQMIDPECSGVLFTCDPVKQNLDEYVISSVFGVGEGLVSGLLDADSFWVDAKSGALNKKIIVEKTGQFRGHSDGGIQKINVAQEKILLPSLNETQIQKLYELGKTLLEKTNRPQDIEWAYSEGSLYVLQSRPVTNLTKNLMGYLHLWDNSNIVESYGGLTSPLSFSFALRNYRAVYIQFCEVLGLPPNIIKDMDPDLSCMLGHLHGRVYYNLYNWYKLVGILPGFKNNREFMETMMGVSEALSQEVTTRIQPHESWSTPRGKIRQLKTGLYFFGYHLAIQPIVDQFLKDFRQEYDAVRSMPIKTMRGDQLIQIYLRIERTMLGKWKAPIINDFLCMVHFGFLRKLTQKWLGSLDHSVQNDLLSAEGGFESAEPTTELLKLAISAMDQPELCSLLIETPPQDGLEALTQSSFSEFTRQVNLYLDRFGFRCMSEMKLEEIDLLTNPSYLFVNLKNYLKMGEDLRQHLNHEKNIRQEAEIKVKTHLHGLKKWLYFWVLHHARKAVKNRENTRFARTRIYGIARTIFQTIGEDLQANGILLNARDIYWLTIEEVMGIFSGTLSVPDLNSFVQIRKQQFEKYQEDIDARIQTRGAVYWNNPLVTEQEPPPPTEDYDLMGLPCCPGEIEGIVKVIHNPNDNLELNGEILVTARTDPGWVPLYPSISGLLVERGSLLSHSAIVAREMGIPAIVSIPGLTKTIKSGMRIRLNGKTGTIKILS